MRRERESGEFIVEAKPQRWESPGLSRSDRIFFTKLALAFATPIAVFLLAWWLGGCGATPGISDGHGVLTWQIHDAPSRHSDGGAE